MSRLTTNLESLFPVLPTLRFVTLNERDGISSYFNGAQNVCPRNNLNN
jgi:hypothetical protein